MGRPYSSELAHFDETYRWALRSDAGSMVKALRALVGTPILAVGSGGSYSAAQFCADMHQRAAGAVARAVTPLELVSMGGPPPGTGVVLYTAGGKNADVQAAWRAAVEAEPPTIVVVTATPTSPVARDASQLSFATLVDFTLEAGRDGFLATNSLLAFCVLTFKAYAEAFGCESPLPQSLESLVPTALETPGKVDTVSVLHGYTTHAAALDFESKCTEAALTHVQLADYRSFAHGRHNWLTKFPDTAVMALVSPEDKRLAHATLRLLPESISIMRYETEYTGMLGGLAALVITMRLIEGLGRLQGVDPGRPGVQSFGSRLYSLRAIERIPRTPSGLDLMEAKAISRKARRPTSCLSLWSRLPYWRAAYTRFLDALGSQVFRGVVFDYDGTLVDPRDRYQGMSVDATGELLRLLETDIPIGVATGRGKSVAHALRDALPSRYWPQVYVGYYNGSVVASLSETAVPDGREEVCDALSTILNGLRTHSYLDEVAEISPRSAQITVAPRDESQSPETWRLVQAVLSRAEISGVIAVRSGHSVDILAPAVTKRALIRGLRDARSTAPEAPMLCVGDRGAWPGNDAALLSEPYALSVDDVSADPTTGWNLAPPGVRGVSATIKYCRAIRPQGSGMFMVDIAAIVQPT